MKIDQGRRRLIAAAKDVKLLFLTLAIPDVG